MIVPRGIDLKTAPAGPALNRDHRVCDGLFFGLPLYNFARLTPSVRFPLVRFHESPPLRAKISLSAADDRGEEALRIRF